MMLCSPLKIPIRSWFRDYVKLQSFAVILIYVQIGCSLVGSLGAAYNGVLLINCAIALFALVAIESGSQSLGRAYAFLLFSAILLDITWFILFSYEIWHISYEDYGMYRLGVSHVQSTASREADFDSRNSFLNPATPAIVRQSSDYEDPIGGSIYDPAYYSSLFEIDEDNGCSLEGPNPSVRDGGSSSNAESCNLKLSLGRSFKLTTDESATNRQAESRLLN